MDIAVGKGCHDGPFHHAENFAVGGFIEINTSCARSNWIETSVVEDQIMESRCIYCSCWIGGDVSTIDPNDCRHVKTKNPSVQRHEGKGWETRA